VYLNGKYININKYFEKEYFYAVLIIFLLQNLSVILAPGSGSVFEMLIQIILLILMRIRDPFLQAWGFEKCLVGAS
jgi:hypothetical protein